MSRPAPPPGRSSGRRAPAGYVDVGKREGATVATGGSALDRPGHSYEPTVLTGVEPDVRVAQEEIFGPVLTVVPFTETAEALEVANGVDYGLVGGVFIGDVTRVMRFARRIESGNVYVNKWFGDTVRTPFGGYKRSGIGREKGFEALDSYLRTKNVAIGLGGDVDLPTN